jgi:hypothetical protein
MITATNYFEEIKKINVSKLPAALSEGHSLVLEAKEAVDNPFQTGDKDIDETLDAYLTKLNEYLSSQNIEPVEKPKKKDIPVKIVKKSAPKAPAEKKKATNKEPKTKEIVPIIGRSYGPYKDGTRSSKLIKEDSEFYYFANKVKFNKGIPFSWFEIKMPKRKVKPTRKKSIKTISVKKSKAQVRKVAAKAVKQARKADAQKPAVTVKKMSVELAILKQFANLQGKVKPVKFVHSFHTRLSNLLKGEMISDHIEMVRNIHKRLYKVIQLTENKPIQNVKFSIEKAFVQKCQEAVRGAKIRLRTDFLAGTKTKNSLYGLSTDELEEIKYKARKKD